VVDPCRQDRLGGAWRTVGGIDHGKHTFGLLEPLTHLGLVRAIAVEEVCLHHVSAVDHACERGNVVRGRESDGHAEVNGTD